MSTAEVHHVFIVCLNNVALGDPQLPKSNCSLTDDISRSHYTADFIHSAFCLYIGYGIMLPT